jgi:mannosylglycoprotein endo-beta-mannosidase
MMMPYIVHTLNGGGSIFRGNLESWIINENLRLLEQEDLYWYNRFHETWLLNGDINTKYFHRVASGSKRKNTILSLKHDDFTIEGDENLLAHATEYYSELFGSAPEFNVYLNNNIWDGAACVSKIDNEQLCKPFSESEIWTAFSQMEKTRQLALIVFL